jgi:hypothetical protein
MDAINLLRQCVNVYVQRIHFVGEHGGKKHDERCRADMTWTRHIMWLERVSFSLTRQPSNGNTDAVDEDGNAMVELL